MKLAYSAYMPLTGQLSGIAPGMFMETGIRTAQEELEDCGFESRIYNNGENDTVCHIIGHKQIYTNVSNNISYNTNGGNDNGSLGSIEKTIGGKSNGSFNDDSKSNLWTDVSMGNVGVNYSGNSEAFGNRMNLSNTDCMRTLVVVDIRGSSTTQDWRTDIGTAFNPEWGSFGAGMEMVLKSLYHGTGDTENFLVTGHSLGAAVANLVAEHLNSCKDTNHCPGSRTEKDIYAYTFATPKTENDITKYDNKKNQNIFNILNNNDIVTFVPTNFSKTNWSDNGWTRYGRDFLIRDF